MRKTLQIFDLLQYAEDGEYCSQINKELEFLKCMETKTGTQYVHESEITYIDLLIGKCKVMISQKRRNYHH